MASASSDIAASKVSIPMSRTDPALAVYERDLRAFVLAALTKERLQWTSVGLWRRGVNADLIDECPPTILITKRDDSPFEAKPWQRVRAQIEEHIKTTASMKINVEITGGEPVPFIAQPLPYPRPPIPGCSFGPLEEGIERTSTGHSGTLGGYLRMTNQAQTRVILTCNHVANPREFMQTGSAADHIQAYEMRSPSNLDHHDTLIVEGENLFKDGKVLAAEKTAASKALEDLLNNIDMKAADREKLRAKNRDQVISDWRDFAQAVDAGAFYTAGFTLRAAMQRDAADLNSCPVNGALTTTLQTFKTTWTAIERDGSSADYRAADTFQRRVGTTRYASGLQIWPDPTHVSLETAQDYNILDWALVEVTSGVGNNTLTAMRALAKDYAPGKALAQGAALQIGRIEDLQDNHIVFKVGRRTGLTMGRVNMAKVDLRTDDFVRAGALLNDNLPHGRHLLSTWEWAVAGLKDPWAEAGMITKPEITANAPFSMGGDSGSWVISEDATLVGIVFYGLENLRTSYIEDINVIRASLQAKTQPDGTHLDFTLP